MIGKVKWAARTFVWGLMRSTFRPILDAAPTGYATSPAPPRSPEPPNRLHEHERRAGRVQGDRQLVHVVPVRESRRPR